MRNDEEEDDRDYRVVVNDEEQYSIWFADRDLPEGWRDVGVAGKKAHCLDHVRSVWTDMRPRSLREQMAEWERDPPPPAPQPLRRPPGPDGRNDLVTRLESEQPVTLAIRPERTLHGLREQIGRRFVLVLFDATQTELGVRLDPERSDLGALTDDASAGVVKLVGHLTLNYNRVELHAEVDLATLRGKGRLHFIEAVAPGAAN